MWFIDLTIDPNELVQLCRQPRFTFDRIEKTYLAWDGTTNAHHDADTIKNASIEGITIRSDWKEPEDKLGWQYTLSTTAVLEGDFVHEKTSAVNDNQGTGSVIVKQR